MRHTSKYSYPFLQESAKSSDANGSLRKNKDKGSIMKVEEVLAELRSTREVLNAQLLQRRTMTERLNQNDSLDTEQKQTAYATVVIDTLNALDCIDAAINIIENETGDVISRAILCLKKQSKRYSPRVEIKNLH